MTPESCQTGFQPRHLVFQTLAIGGAGRNIALGLPARGGASKHKDMWGLGARIASAPLVKCATIRVRTLARNSRCFALQACQAGENVI